ncbi:MAG TPA: PQQ-binding-like beta-propeller repeat protein, partial [Candidatus Nitrosotalea sp.]|nr:PQQ-binding-like beta-propeller repeat protein [Candidatus Nitrosotalea sp.]
MKITIALLAVAVAAMFRGGPAHPGVYDSSAPTLSAVRWRFTAHAKFFSSPTVSDGAVYIGASNGRLYAVRLADGTPLWNFAAKGSIDSTPAVAGGVVFFSSRDGNIYALDALTGAKRWSFATDGERRFTAPGIHGITPKHEMMPDPFDVFLSSPAVAGGVVYAGSGDHNVYALDAATGRLRWKFATANVVHASPAVAGGTVFIGSWDRYLYALDARSGALKWKFATGDDRDT